MKLTKIILPVVLLAQFLMLGCNALEPGHHKMHNNVITKIVSDLESEKIANDPIESLLINATDSNGGEFYYEFIKKRGLNNLTVNLWEDMMHATNNGYVSMDLHFRSDGKARIKIHGDSYLYDRQSGTFEKIPDLID